MFQAAALSLTSFLGACATTLLPTYEAKTIINPNNCDTVEYESLSRSLLVPFNYTKSDSTKINYRCYSARAAISFLLKGNDEGKLLATHVYDNYMDETYRGIVDERLNAHGTSMKKIRETLPKVESTSTDAEGCITMKYTNKDNAKVYIFECPPQDKLSLTIIRGPELKMAA